MWVAGSEDRHEFSIDKDAINTQFLDNAKIYNMMFQMTDFPGIVTLIIFTFQKLVLHL